MVRRVALLRAINVGGHVVKMDRLRGLFEELGFERVETLIASGNVLFDSAAGNAATLETEIERHLERALGYPVATFVRTPAELEAVVAYEPFARPPSADAGLSIAFMKRDPGSAVAARLAAMCTDSDELHVHRRELYWRYQGRMSDSQLWRTPMEKVIGGPATARNVTTVRKLAEQLRAG